MINAGTESKFPNRVFPDLQEGTYMCIPASGRMKIHTARSHDTGYMSVLPKKYNMIRFLRYSRKSCRRRLPRVRCLRSSYFQMKIPFSPCGRPFRVCRRQHLALASCESGPVPQLTTILKFRLSPLEVPYGDIRSFQIFDRNSKLQVPIHLI